MLKVGDRAPDFSLPDQNGTLRTLKELRGSSSLVVFFYPKDNTTGCTAQSCSFRDNYPVFQKKGANIVGISQDSPASHKEFAKSHSLPYPLLSDAKGQAAKLFGVSKTLGLLPGRATFIVDNQGIIRFAFSSQFNIQRHVDDALEALSTASEAKK